MAVKVGIDLICVQAVSDAIREHGDRYLTRVYTAAERDECAGRPELLAARFAAKEATMKVLGRGDEALPWASIATQRQRGDELCVELRGAAAAMAAQRGVPGELCASVGRARGSVAALIVTGSPR